MIKAIIPGETVRILRSALQGELGNPAASLERASMAKEKERRPELFHAPLIELNATCAMLDALGWCEFTDPASETSVQLDFDVYRRVTLDAMRTKLMVERDFVTQRDDTGERNETYEQAHRDIALIEAFLAEHGSTERSCED